MSIYTPPASRITDTSHYTSTQQHPTPDSSKAFDIIEQALRNREIGSTNAGNEDVTNPLDLLGPDNVRQEISHEQLKTIGELSDELDALLNNPDGWGDVEREDNDETNIGFNQLESANETLSRWDFPGEEPVYTLRGRGRADLDRAILYESEEPMPIDHPTRLSGDDGRVSKEDAEQLAQEHALPPEARDAAETLATHWDTLGLGDTASLDDLQRRGEIAEAAATVKNDLNPSNGLNSYLSVETELDWYGPGLLDKLNPF